jgi:polyphosphate kinase
MARVTENGGGEIGTEPIQVDLPDFSRPEYFSNRELSWLEFNARVLEEARDSSTPLLEQFKFLGIVSSNLDEFFMVRIAGIKVLEKAGVERTRDDGLKPVEVLTAASAMVHRLVAEQCWYLRDSVLPALEAEGICVKDLSDLPTARLEELERHFDDNVSPVLTPLAIDPSHPFPLLQSLSLNLAIVFEHDTEQIHNTGVSAPAAFAIVRVPAVLPRLIPLDASDGSQSYILLEDLVARFCWKLFPTLAVQRVHCFRVTRNSDLLIEEDDIDNLLQTVDLELRSRRFREAVRLEVSRSMPQATRRKLMNATGLSEIDLYEIDGPMALHELGRIYKDCRHSHLKDPSFNPRISADLDPRADIFAVLRSRDILLHHPYESFSTVVEFLQSAADDPDVLAIKQTLYRTSGNSPIVEALMQAAANGKQVTAMVELRARFDERNNIVWAQALEEAGVHVVWGVLGFKTHAKACLVVRREEGQLVQYVHLGTGNYNPTTAKLYTDIGLLTSNPEIGRNVAALFNLITGFNYMTGARLLKSKDAAQPWSKLLVAPVNLHDTIQKLILAEARQAAKGKEARIIATMNQLVERQTIVALYEASCMGVKIDLVVRGICCLRPGIPGISDNIRVTSIVDRFLEHSRVFYFFAGGKEKVYAGSADWMPRNFFRRIEAVYPVENPEHKRRIIDVILPIQLADNVKARMAQPDGTYRRRVRAPGEAPLRSQERFIELARELAIKSDPYDDAVRNAKKARRRRGKKRK